MDKGVLERHVDIRRFESAVCVRPPFPTPDPLKEPLGLGGLRAEWSTMVMASGEALRRRWAWGLMRTCAHSARAL